MAEEKFSSRILRIKNLKLDWGEAIRSRLDVTGRGGADLRDDFFKLDRLLPAILAGHRYVDGHTLWSCHA